MRSVHNFSVGPAVLPESVLQEAADCLELPAAKRKNLDIYEAIA